MRKVLSGALALVILSAAPVSAATFEDRDAFVARYVAEESSGDKKVDPWAKAHAREPRPMDGWAHEPILQREAWVAFVVKHGYPKPPPPPEPEVAVVSSSSSASYSSTPASSSIWDLLAGCESGGNWAENAGTIFDGGLQFHPDTWTGYGGGEFAPEAWQATREQQIVIAERVLAGQGWGAWPSCAAKLGLL